MARISFTVEIAGIPVEIRCRHGENREFMKDYLSDRDPAFVVDPTDEEIANLRNRHEELISMGLRKNRCSDIHLENTMIHVNLCIGMLDYQVLLLHGSAICLDGEVCIFTAPPGTGKSTHTRLWRGVFGDRAYMINDDMPMLVVSRDKVEVYGSPWTGKHELGCNGHAPLKAIIELTRDTENHINGISAVEAFPIIKRQAYAASDVNVMKKVFPIEKKILEIIPFYCLGCNMEDDAARVAWKGIYQIG